MSLPTDIQDLFREVWEKDINDPTTDITPSTVGHPDWDEEYLSGNKWATFDDVPVFFRLNAIFLLQKFVIGIKRFIFVVHKQSNQYVSKELQNKAAAWWGSRETAQPT